MHLYRILNIKNNKEYAGISVNKSARFRKHLWRLKTNSHENRHLQFAWNKYGKESFKFEIVNELNSLDELNKAEIEYIALNKLQDRDFGYNLDAGGKGRIHTQEAKNKIAKAQLKPVVSMCVKSHKITIYESVNDVNNAGFSNKNISTACKNGRFTHLKHVWVYKSEYDKDQSKLLEKAIKNINTKSRPEYYRPVVGKNIKTSETIEFKNILESETAGYNSTVVRSCCIDGKKNISHKGYVWAFKEYEHRLDSKIERYKTGRVNAKIIYKFDMYGNLIDELKRDRINTNKINSSINSVCLGTRLYSNGFIYLYNKEEINERLISISKTVKSFIKMDLNGIIIEEYCKMEDLLLKNPEINNTSSIYRVCNGERSTAYGFKWEYKKVVGYFST